MTVRQKLLPPPPLAGRRWRRRGRCDNDHDILSPSPRDAPEQPSTPGRGAGPRTSPAVGPGNWLAELTVAAWLTAGSAAAPVVLQAVAALLAAELAAALRAEAGTAPVYPAHRGVGTPAPLGGVVTSREVLPESWQLLSAGC